MRTTLEALTFDEYIKLAECTVMVDINNFLYYAMGLIGECDEYQDDSSVEEMGDVLWYYGQLLRSLNLQMDNLQYPEQYEFEFKVGSSFGQRQDILKKSIEIGQLCQKLQRSVEFEEYEFTDEKYQRLKSYLINFGKGLATEAAVTLQVSKDDIYKDNIQKLYKRHEKLTGVDFYKLNGIKHGNEDETKLLEIGPIPVTEEGLKELQKFTDKITGKENLDENN